MKTEENNFVTGRRNALKILGLSSAALFSGVLGDIPSGKAMGMVKDKKPFVSNGRSSVAFATGTDRKTMIPEVMKPFEQQIREGIKGKQLIIKPNMVSTTVPLCATHVDALRALLEFMKPIYKGQIIIAEATAGKGESTPGFTNYGYTDLQKDYNIKFVDLNQTEGAPVWIIDRDLHPDKIQITNMFLDPKNYIISISRLKTHNAVIMTAGTKNMCMAAPLNISAANGNPQVNYKSRMHSGGPRWLHYNIFLVARQVRANFTIVDGVEGMQGNGPVNGFPVDHHIALASTDVLAVDSMCAKLMDIPLENLGYLNYCAADGLGVIDRDKIDIIGGKDPGQYVIPYKLHDTIANQMMWKGPFNPNATPAQNPPPPPPPQK
jgi:uncharacterized protein (DUF362 family)